MLIKILQINPLRWTKRTMWVILLIGLINIIKGFFDQQGLGFNKILLAILILIAWSAIVFFTLIKIWQSLILKQQEFKNDRFLMIFYFSLISIIIINTFCNAIAWLVNLKWLITTSQIINSCALIAILIYYQREWQILIKCPFDKMVLTHFGLEKPDTWEQNNETNSWTQRIAKLNREQLEQIAKQLRICDYQNLEVEQLRSIIQKIYQAQELTKNGQ